MIGAAKAALGFMGKERRSEWWRDAAPRLLVLFVGVWGIEPMSRGIDFILGDAPQVRSSLTELEQSAPLWFWGTVTLIGGFLVFSGAMLKSFRALAAGCLVVGATYGTTTAGLIAICVDRGGDGFRTPVLFGLYSLSWVLASVAFWAKDVRARMMLEAERGAAT